MDYYIRAFCTAEPVPPLVELMGWLREREVRVTVEHLTDPLQLQSREWREVSLAYDTGRQPIVVECRRLGRAGETKGQNDVSYFLDKVGAPGRSAAKKRVVAHLKETRYVVACKLPVDDMNDAGWDANGQILSFLSEKCGALIQADREGFYQRSELILSVE